MLDLFNIIPKELLGTEASVAKWMSENVSVDDQALYWLIVCVLDRPYTLTPPEYHHVDKQQWETFTSTLFSPCVELTDLVRICTKLKNTKILHKDP